MYVCVYIYIYIYTEGGGNTVQIEWMTTDSQWWSARKLCDLKYEIQVQEILLFSSQKVHFVCIISTNRLLLCRGLVTVYVDDRTIFRNDLWDKIRQIGWSIFKSFVDGKVRSSPV